MKRRIGEYLQLLAEAGYVTKSELYHSGMKRVEGLTYESGKAGPGTLFVCKGASFRREYLEEAVERGAVCYVSEQDYGQKYQRSHAAAGRELLSGSAGGAPLYRCHRYEGKDDYDVLYQRDSG